MTNQNPKQICKWCGDTDCKGHSIPKGLKEEMMMEEAIASAELAGATISTPSPKTVEEINRKFDKVDLKIEIESILQCAFNQTPEPNLEYAINDMIDLFSSQRKAIGEEIMEAFDKARCDPGDIVTGYVIELTTAATIVSPLFIIKKTNENHKTITTNRGKEVRLC